MSWKFVALGGEGHTSFLFTRHQQKLLHILFAACVCRCTWQSHFFTSSRPSLTMINPFAVLASALRRTIRSIFVLFFVTLYAPPEQEPQEEPESRSKLIHELQTALAAAGRTYLGGLAGERTAALVQKVRGGDELEEVEEIRYAQCLVLMMANWE